MNAPTISPESVRARLATELSLPSRVGYTSLLLISFSGAALVGELLLNEKALPLRTQLAFGVLLLICTAWCAFAGWVLTQRRVLYAQHHVVAAGMAIAFSLVFIAGTVIVGVQRASGTTWLLAPAVGAGMLVVGLLRLRVGRRRVAALTKRRAELEAALRKETYT